MTTLPLRTVDAAPDHAKALLAAAEKRNALLPNLLRVLANGPVALETYRWGGATTIEVAHHHGIDVRIERLDASNDVVGQLDRGNLSGLEGGNKFLGRAVVPRSVWLSSSIHHSPPREGVPQLFALG